MKLRNLLLTGLSFVLVAAVSIGGTLAYLTSTADDVNVMTLGNVEIKQHEYQRVTNDDGSYKTDTIDGQTSYVLEAFKQGKALLPIVGDPNEPGNSPAYAGYDNTIVRMTQVDSYGSMQVFAGKNAQDKFVTVENTGKSDAYVRTLVAIENGTGDANLIGIGSRCVAAEKAATSTAPWVSNYIGQIIVDGNTYGLFEYVYRGASDVSRHVNGVLPAGDTTYPSLCQVYLKHNATNEDMEAIDGNGNGTLDILVLSQAVQVEGFADAKTALDTAFGDITTTNHPWLTDAPSFNAPANDAELEDALKNENAKQIIVNLTGDVTYDVAAWANDAMGGEKTEYIMINGNGHTITFNQTNSDWNNIVTNGAKLIINNAKITNAGHNNGPWNRHDLNFACEVELNNVISDKALAFKAGATLNNVIIDDANTSDTYAIWIQPNGQTVTLNDCTIDMLDCTDGRGIKIDEQYVSNPAKVTLNVSNTTFKTEEKSAILVKSAAGAEINLSNIDITGVAADPINHVWVDEASEAYADLVVVNGGKKIVEGNQIDPSKIVIIKTADDLFAFATDINDNGNSYSGKTVILGADIDLENRAWTPIGQTGATEFRGTFDGLNHTIKNLYVDNSAYTDEHTSTGLFGWAESGVTIKNVKVDGAFVKGNHNVAVIVGYTYSGKIINCHVSNATVVCNHANGDACGDKAGTIAGYTADEAKLSGCSASDSTVTAGRDAGQLFGLAYTKSVSDCSATNVVVSATGDCNREGNIRNEVIGRVMG